MARIRWPISSDARAKAIQAFQAKAPASSGPNADKSTVAPKDPTTTSPPSPPPAPRLPSAHHIGKRKSRGSVEGSDTPKSPKSPKTSPKIKERAALLDVSGITIPEDEVEDSGVVRIYDTCDTVRHKIESFLSENAVSKAEFLRALVTAAYGPDSPKEIQWTSLKGFQTQNGALAGNASAVYYAAYVFFEKRRIKEGKPKSEDREKMEEIHPDGVDTKVPFGRVSYVGSANMKLVVDEYGRVISS